MHRFYQTFHLYLALLILAFISVYISKVEEKRLEIFFPNLRDSEMICRVKDSSVSGHLLVH